MRKIVLCAVSLFIACTPVRGPFSGDASIADTREFKIKYNELRVELRNLRPKWWNTVLLLWVPRHDIFQYTFKKISRLGPQRLRAVFVVKFQGESGVGVGVCREYLTVLFEEMLSPDKTLFTAASDGASFTIHPSSLVDTKSLEYFDFAGRIVAKSVFEMNLLPFSFTRSMLKHMLGKAVDCEDLKEEDPDHHRSLQYVLRHSVHTLGYPLYFTTEVIRNGHAIELDLKPGGGQIRVTDDNKEEYAQLLCSMKLHGIVKNQIEAFLRGFYTVMPKTLLREFNEEELGLVMSGEPTIDVEDLERNTNFQYEGKSELRDVTWYEDCLRSFNQTDLAMFLQFVTGSPKQRKRGFDTLVNTITVIRSNGGPNSLPTASTCFRQLALPHYRSYNQFCSKLLTAIQMGSRGFINGT